MTVPGPTENRALLDLARRLVWWEPPQKTLARPERLVARAMAEGTWEDMLLVRATYGDEALRRILGDPPPGVFDPRSWTYWHVVFGIEPVPPLPRRRL